MNKTNLTRREARTIPPEGGIFLCPTEMVPDYIVKGLTTLNDERKKCARAQMLLDRALKAGQERRAGTIHPTYGKELEAYVLDRSAKPEERSLDYSIVNSVETIEYLYDQSSTYRGMRDAIRLTANRVGTDIVTQLQQGDQTRIGFNDYVRQRGPFDYEFLCRVNRDDQPLTLFDWGGESDDSDFVHAHFRDQVMLLSDVIVQSTEQQCSPMD